MAKNDPSKAPADGDPGRLNLTLAKSLIAAFQQEASRLDVGGARAAATLAIGAYMGMPDSYRKALIFWAQSVRYDEQREVTPDEVWRKLASLVKAEANIRPIGGVDPKKGKAAPPGVELTEGEATHFIDRIVDPHAKGAKKKTGSGD